MSNKYLVYTLKIFAIMLGCYILSIGVDFFFKSEVGGDSMAVFIQGVSKSFNIKAGLVTYLINFVLISIIAIFDYKKIGVGTILIVVFYGFILNFVLDNSFIPYSTYWLTSLVYCLSACLIAGFAISIWLVINFGLSPLEGVIVIISEKTKKSFTFYKIMVDLFLLTSGFLLGGTFFYGTVIASFLVGPIISTFLKLYKKIKINTN